MPLKITFQDGEINEYLRVDAGQDTTTIATLLVSAMDEAEQELNTDFSTVTTNGDGSTTTTLNEAPATVKEWVLNRLAEKYENRGNTPDPNFSTLKKYRRINFGGFKNLNKTNDMPETAIVNGADVYENQ